MSPYNYLAWLFLAVWLFVACAMTTSTDSPKMLPREEVLVISQTENRHVLRLAGIWESINDYRSGLASLIYICGKQECPFPESELNSWWTRNAIADYYLNKAWVAMYEGDDELCDMAADAAEKELEAIANAIDGFVQGVRS